MRKELSIILMLVFLVGLAVAVERVAVSIVPQKTFVKAVAGERVEVITMIPPGYSPANYAPDTRQLMAFSDASVYFTIGVPAEESNILPRIAKLNQEVRIVPLEGIVNERYEPRYFSGGSIDPHIWLSPKRVIVMIEVIEETLSELMPDQSGFFKKNAADYIGKLETTDEVIKEKLSNIETQSFFVYHPSFGYFAQDYGLKMYAVEQNGKAPSPKRLSELIDLAGDQNIGVIFYQPEIDSRQTRIFASEIDGVAKEIDPLASNYIDNLLDMADTFLEYLNNTNNKAGEAD